MTYIYIFILSILISCPSYAQSQKERRRIMDNRLDKIEFYHLGIGLDVSGNENYILSPKIYVGIGSNRNLYNLDLGLKLSCSNIKRSTPKEYISSYYLPFFLSGNLNFIRWEKKCIYAGAEISYNIALGSRHHVNRIIADTDQRSIADNHPAWQGKLGFRNKYWDFTIYYENDLSPALNQKFVYESISYDYLQLYNSIFERSRLGISVSYNFRF